MHPNSPPPNLLPPTRRYPARRAFPPAAIKPAMSQRWTARGCRALQSRASAAVVAAPRQRPDNRAGRRTAHTPSRPRPLESQHDASPARALPTRHAPALTSHFCTVAPPAPATQLRPRRRADGRRPAAHLHPRPCTRRVALASRCKTCSSRPPHQAARASTDTNTRRVPCTAACKRSFNPCDTTRSARRARHTTQHRASPPNAIPVIPHQWDEPIPHTRSGPLRHAVHRCRVPPRDRQRVPPLPTTSTRGGGSVGW